MLRQENITVQNAGESVEDNNLIPGDIVVILSPDGLYNRMGDLGIVLGPFLMVDPLDRLEILIKEPTEDGYIAVYAKSSLEVIDHMQRPILSPINLEVIKEIKKAHPKRGRKET
jgi:hypothetical protein